eukprot:ANDGO_01800.mRNA.1 Erg28 protein
MLDFLYGLPPLSGWLLFVAAMGGYGCLQAMFTSQLRTKQFSLKQSQVTPLVHHSFAAWTAASTVTRLSCALDTYNRSLYRATMVTFGIASAYYIYQVFVHKSVPFKFGLPAFLIANISLVWMTHSYAHYTQ